MYTHSDQTQKGRHQSIAKFVSDKQGGSRATLWFVDNRSESIVQRKLQAMADTYISQQQQSIQRKGQQCIQRMPEERARQVSVTYNSQFHVGNAPVTSGVDAVNLTQARMNGGWNGEKNHVIYDFNKKNLEEMLFDRLKNDRYFTLPNNHYLVQLPDVNYYIVRRNGTFELSGGQCAMRVDNSNMNAYHMEFPK